MISAVHGQAHNEATVLVLQEFNLALGRVDDPILANANFSVEPKLLATVSPGRSGGENLHEQIWGAFDALRDESPTLP